MRPALSSFVRRCAWLLAALPLPAQESPAGATPLAGRVVGRDGAPVAHAEISLRWRVRPELPGLVGRSLGRTGVEESRHRAGDDGRFRIRPPHRGPFSLIAKAGGRQSQQAFPAMAGDFHELTLSPLAEIGGTVTDPDGAPAPDVVVRLVPHATTWSRLALYRIPERRAETRSGADGRFRLPFDHGYLGGPRWGTLMVAWAHAGERASSVHAMVRPVSSSLSLDLALEPGRAVRGRLIAAESGRGIGGATVFDPLTFGVAANTDATGAFATQLFSRGPLLARAPGRRPVELALPPERYRHIPETRMEQGASLRARLVDRRGAPLAGARVLLAVPRGGAPPVEWIRRTGRAGEVAFDEAWPGRTLLAFVEVGDLFVRFHAAAIEGDVDRGRVVVDADRRLGGQVLAADGTPLRDARVALSTDPLVPSSLPRITYSDRGGRFAFDAVPAGDHVVLAEAGEHGMATLDVPRGRFPEVATIRFSEGAAIAGEVIDDQGRPVARAWLTIVHAGGAAAAEMPGPTMGMTSLCGFSDQRGRFRFGGLPTEGTWTVLCNELRDGTIRGGSAPAETGRDDVVVQLTQVVR